MSRVFAVVFCGLSVAACGSFSLPSMDFSMPSMDFPKFGPGTSTAAVRVESDPPGAEAKASTGQVCRTPCTLAITAQRDFTVNFMLNGYLPQSVQAQLVQPANTHTDPEISASAPEPHITPDPIFAALDRAPPPARKTPAPTPKPRTTAAPPKTTRPATTPVAPRPAASEPMLTPFPSTTQPFPSTTR
jgi:hypothetical protein